MGMNPYRKTCLGMNPYRKTCSPAVLFGNRVPGTARHGEWEESMDYLHHAYPFSDFEMWVNCVDRQDQ